MTEKIIRIEETTFSKIPKDYTSYDGYLVITDAQTIRLGIDNSQSCCENWGYFWCNDNTQDFIGAILRDVTITNEALITEKVPNTYEGSAMFVNLETDRGTLQFVAYNEHNGYYGHDAIVQCSQLDHSEYL